MSSAGQTGDRKTALPKVLAAACTGQTSPSANVALHCGILNRKVQKNVTAHTATGPVALQTRVFSMHFGPVTARSSPHGTAPA